MFSYSVPESPALAGFGMVSARFVLVVDGDTDSAEVEALWSIVNRPDARLEDVLARLSQRGLDAVPDFALVELRDAGRRQVQAALRGTGVIHLVGESSHRLSGANAETWIEQSVDGVDHMSVGLHSAVPGERVLPLQRGVTVTDRIHLGLAARSDAPQHATVVLDDETILGSARQPQTPDDATVLGARRVARAGLVFDDGRTIALAERIVVGRAPRASARPGARLVQLPSPRREISGTHAELELDGEVLLLSDLESTNGTVVTTPGADPVLVRGGEPYALPLGSIVDFGDGNRASFERLTPPRTGDTHF